MTGHVSDLPSFAEQLGWLLDHVRRKDGGKLTDRDIAAATATFGHPLSPAHVGKLRKGETASPGRDALRAVAHAFGVSASYFVDAAAAERIRRKIASGEPAESEETDLDVPEAGRNGGVLLRGWADMSPDTQDVLRLVANHFHELDSKRGEASGSDVPAS